ncbi:unnamed protein product [Fraxinus pennsylvanica]|uniref:S-locus receptor kinase C-terminal domain-containing protein n=1 Tax=Fraxinus pennsylvanica TaxID=56036 RepID=A0AAD1YW27_9LAMI|nr:unnamed protein product [Fraxinus pennsylvanica]
MVSILGANRWRSKHPAHHLLGKMDEHRRGFCNLVGKELHCLHFLLGSSTDRDQKVLCPSNICSLYSFLMLVLEIVRGKRNRGFSYSDHHNNLLGHAWMLYREGRSLELVDAYLGISDYLSEVQRSIHVGLLCVQHCPGDRPSMSLLVLMLGNEGVLPQAKQPGFFTERDLFAAESLTSTTAATSLNHLTISMPEAR